MPRYAIPYLFCALVSVVSFEAPAAQTISPAAAQEDFDVLWKSIHEAHGGLTRHATRADLDRRVAAHRARLDRPMSTGAFAARIQESISELRDGHMRLEPDSVTAAALSTAMVFPIGR